MQNKRNYHKMITLSQASFCSGVSRWILKKDILLGRLDAIMYRGRWLVDIHSLIDYCDWIYQGNRECWLCPKEVLLHRLDYVVFGIYE